MIEDATVNLAPILNFLIYAILFVLFNALCRWIIRITYGKKVVRIARAEALRVMADHYKEYQYKESKILEDALHKVDLELKNRFRLRYGPIKWYAEDIRSEFGDWNTIPEYFTINSIDVDKKFWFYRMRLRKHVRFNSKTGEAIDYKSCLVSRRENSIDNILND